MNEAREKKIRAALSDLRAAYKKHGVDVVKAAMNRYVAAMRQKSRAEKMMRDAQEELRKAEKLV